MPGSSGENNHEAHDQRGPGGSGGCREVPRRGRGVVPAARRPLRELMGDRLLERSRDSAGGLRLTSEGSMLGSAHLGYEKGGRGGTTGNAPNGTIAKTVQRGVGPVPLQVPRDRAGSFEPVLVPKRAGRVPSWTVSPTGRSRPDSGCFSLLDRYLIGSGMTAGCRVRGRAGGGAGRSRRRAACCGRGRRATLRNLASGQAAIVALPHTAEPRMTR
jgi:hypothetical protein